MELRHYIRVLRKGWLVVLAGIVLGAGVSVLLTVTTKPVYQATAQIFVATVSSDNTALAAGNTFTQDRVQSYTKIVDSPTVTDAVVKNLGLDLTGDELGKKITADAPQGQVLINLSAVDGNPEQAARIANETATVFSEFVEKTEQTDANGNPVVKLTVTKPANVPGSPVSPRKVLNTALGVLIGLVAGIVIAIARDALDNTIKSPIDFEPLGLATLGYVPLDKRTSRSPIAFRADPHGGRAEAYRAVRTNLQFVDVDNPPRLLAVTSSVPGEGKTTTAINLAAALAEAGYRVCLIDADLRRPSVAKVLGLVGDVGFTTVLISDTPVEEVLQNGGRNLAVLTSGPVPPNPSELLISSHARSVIADIASKVDFTIVDTPPLLPVTDGAEMATIVDATLLVARAGKTTREQLSRSVEALAKVGEKPVGVILNMLRSGGSSDEYQYSYYYSYRPTSDGRRRRDDDNAEVAEAGSGTAAAATDAADDAEIVDDPAVAANPAESTPDAPSGEDIDPGDSRRARARTSTTDADVTAGGRSRVGFASRRRR